MGKISVGVMVLAVLFTLCMCKCGWAYEAGPSQEHGTAIGATGQGEDHLIGEDFGIGGDQTPGPHHNRGKEKEALTTGNSGGTVVMPVNSGYGQYPTPVYVPSTSPEH